MHEFKLANRMKQRADTLSGGQKQRLSLAAATLHKPRMLFLDEPTSAVDPQNRRDFWEKLFELAELGTTILVSTHYMDEAERCHKLAILDEGVKVADGTPKDLGNSIASNVFEVTATDPNAARLSLAAQQGITSITQLGVRLRVLVPKELSNALSLLQGNLSVANVEADVQQVFPDLEDVFVSVTDLRRREGLAA
jgi:ABC-2 type transport system ATP-binding protein